MNSNIQKYAYLRIIMNQRQINILHYTDKEYTIFININRVSLSFILLRAVIVIKKFKDFRNTVKYRIVRQYYGHVRSQVVSIKYFERYWDRLSDQ